MQKRTKIITITFFFMSVFVMLSTAQNNNKDMGKSFYTPEEVERMCGTRLDSLERKNVLARQDSMYKDYLMNKGLRKTTTVPNWRGMMGPVENQNSESCTHSCWAHSATGATEGQLHISSGSNIGIDLNEMDIVANASPVCQDWYVSSAFNYIQSSKAISETGSYPNLQGVRWDILSYNSISGITAIKNALVSGPVTASFDVYTDFDAFFNNPANRYAVYHYDGTSGRRGGHSVVIVSYDETNQYWLCKNSWGSAWADGGYFRIGFAQCGIESWDNYYASVNQSVLCKDRPWFNSHAPDCIELSICVKRMGRCILQQYNHKQCNYSF